MALLIQCNKCHKRSAGALDKCPHCSSANVRFIIDYWPHGRLGHRIRQILPDKITSAASARTIEELMTKKRKAKDLPAPRPGNNVAELFPLYLQDYSKLYHRETTQDDIANVYAASYSKILGHLRVEDTDDMEYYIKMRKAEGVANRTVNKELDYFSGFRKWCKKKYNIPLPLDRTERLPYKRPLPQIIAVDEVVKIWDATDPFYQAYFLGLFTTGLRDNETKQLQRKDLDFQNRLVRVIQKGGSYKILPLDDWFIRALKKIGAHKLAPDDYVFLNSRTGRPIQRVNRAIDRACLKAGVERHVTPHLFRHSVATFLMGKNVNMRLIQGYMGHTKINTTEWYTHVDVENLRAVGKVIQKEYEAVRAAQKKALSTKARAR